MEIKDFNEMREIDQQLWDKYCISVHNKNDDDSDKALNKSKQFQTKKWVAVDDLIKRIETICNHGNERDMRFRNLLMESLSTSNEGTELKFKVPSANATDKPCLHSNVAFDANNNRKCANCGKYEWQW